MARTPEEDKVKTSPLFQKKLISLIEKSELTKEAFAEAAHVNKDIISRGTIYGIIPSVRSLIKLADYLNLPITDVLGETKTENFYKSDYPTTFHKRLKELIEEKGTTPAKLANIMEFANNSIYEWNRTGELPSLHYLRGLSKYFDVSMDYLLGRTDDRKN